MKKVLIVLVTGIVLTFLGFGIYSGIIPNWLRTRFPLKTPTPSATPTPSPSPSPEPSIAPRVKAIEVPAKTTKGGLPLASTSTASYATLLYEYQVKSTDPWITHAQYDTRYLKDPMIFEEVSVSYARRLTVCFYSQGGTMTCQNGSLEPGVHTVTNSVNNAKLTYEIKRDAHGPVITLSAPFKNQAGTCVRVENIQDDISPLEKITRSEKMDTNDWRELHSEYCVNSGNEHTYVVKAVDERGNTTETSLKFNLL